MIIKSLSALSTGRLVTFPRLQVTVLGPVAGSPETIGSLISAWANGATALKGAGPVLPLMLATPENSRPCGKVSTSCRSPSVPSGIGIVRVYSMISPMRTLSSAASNVSLLRVLLIVVLMPGRLKATETGAVI